LHFVSEITLQKHIGSPKPCRFESPYQMVLFNGMARFVPGFTGDSELLRLCNSIFLSEKMKNQKKQSDD
jgi:hypothetical protein